MFPRTVFVFLLLAVSTLAAPQNAGDAASSLAADGANALGHALSNISSSDVKHTAEKAGSLADKAGSAAVNGAKAVGKLVKDVTNDAGNVHVALATTALVAGVGFTLL